MNLRANYRSLGEVGIGIRKKRLLAIERRSYWAFEEETIGIWTKPYRSPEEHVLGSGRNPIGPREKKYWVPGEKFDCKFFQYCKLRDL